MRHIEFIAPVAAVRGNLSGTQKLLYPTDNNSAWDSPSNKRNYATNYTPRYIGAKRSRDGHTYFAVKQRSAVTMSDAMRLQQAVIGGTKVIYDAIMHDQRVLPVIQAMYADSAERSQGWSMYRYITTFIRASLKGKIAGIFFNAPGQSSVVVQNPWISTAAPGTPIQVTIDPALLAKFWQQLANNPIIVRISGYTIIAHSGNSWSDVASSSYNVANLSTQAQYIIIGSSAGNNGLFIGTMSGDVFTKELNETIISAETQYTARWDSL